MSVPLINNRVITADGNWQKFEFLENTNSVVIRARTAVAIQIKGEETAGAYLTVDSGSAWSANAGNMYGAHVYVKATAGVEIEIACQVID